jgi:hypothetical protein
MINFSLITNNMSKYLMILTGLFLCSGACLNAQALYNKGAVYVGATNGSASLYIKGNLKVIGNDVRIGHAGTTVLTGHFINDVTAGNVFTSRGGTFKFKGSDTQLISGSADKANCYIKFPDQVVIQNQQPDSLRSTVRIDPNMGATMKNIDFQKGRLVLDSKTVDADHTAIAHLLAETGGTINYKPKASGTGENEGVVQVNLSLGNNYAGGQMVGFSPPFEKMYADYFLFNFLADPKQNDGIFNGSKDFWIKDPKTPLPAGRGYVLGQGLVPWNGTYPANPYYAATLDPQYGGARQQDAIRDTFVFARRFAPASLKQYVTVADGYTGEKLNTSDVTVTLTGNDKYVYLGNPYTVPLDLSELAGPSVLSDGTWGTAAPTISKGYHILSEGEGHYLPNTEFSFTPTFLLVQGVGGTASNYYVAPMQMFVVHWSAATTGTFKIPASKRTHGTKSFLRSDDTPQVIDELLIETKDGMTGGYDRLCVVFRNSATLASSDMFDAPKLFNRTGGVNQIYTRSSDNKELTTTIIPPSTRKLTMYFEPSRQTQEVTLKADRISSISSVGNIVLEDMLTGKLLDLKRSSIYRFVSSPDDRIDRFVLHFDDGTVGTDDVLTSSILRAKYEAGLVWVYGVKENQIGCTASVYDMLGNLLYQQTVTEAPSFRIDKILSKGIYMIRLSGDGTPVAKFAVR